MPRNVIDFLENKMKARRACSVSALLFAVLIASVFVMTVEAADKTVVDHAGRSVQVPVSPAAVISLAPSVTEIVFALDRQEVLKGVTTFSDFPAAAENLPKIGSYIHPDMEKIVSLAPDLCIAVKDGNPKQVVMRIVEMGIPVYAVNPRCLESVMASIIDIGGLLEASHRAEEIVADMRRRMGRVAAGIAGTADRPAVFFQINASPIVSAGHDTFIHELIVRAGGRNLAGDQPSYPRFTIEQVLALSPDIIIVTTMSGKGESDGVVDGWRQWARLPAVKNDRVLVVDSGLFDRPGPRLIDALELLVGLIHPKTGNQ
jgi:iron complex transport system substrate-binding protein